MLHKYGRGTDQLRPHGQRWHHHGRGFVWHNTAHPTAEHQTHDGIANANQWTDDERLLERRLCGPARLNQKYAKRSLHE